MAYRLQRNLMDGNIQIEIQTIETGPEIFTSDQISPGDHQAQASLPENRRVRAVVPRIMEYGPAWFSNRKVTMTNGHWLKKNDCVSGV